MLILNHHVKKKNNEEFIPVFQMYLCYINGNFGVVQLNFFLFSISVESGEINNYWLSGIISNIQSSFLLFSSEISQDFSKDSHQEIYFEALSMFCFYQLISLSSTFKTLKCKISVVS